MSGRLERAVGTLREWTGRLRGAGLAGATIAMRTKIWEEVPHFAQASLLPLVVRDGVHVGTVHAIHAIAHPDRLALVDARRAWNFRETNDLINQVCHGFQNLVPHGQRPRVVLCMENRVEYALVWFALFRLGWPAVHASDAGTVDELRYLFEHSEPAIAVGSNKTIERLAKAAPSKVSLINVEDAKPLSRVIHLESYIARFSREMYQRKRNLAVENVVYTSGTTGKPKGAVRDFGRMGVMELVEILERLPISLQERHLVVSKLYHSAGQAFLLIMAALGATIYLEDHFDPEAILASIHRNEITSMFMVPTMISRVLALGDEAFEKYPPSALAMIVSGAAAFGQPLRERAIARFGPNRIYDFYGASELGWVTLINGQEMLDRPGSQGTPLRGQEIRVVDSNGVLPPTEMGLIQVRTFSRMEGYLGDVKSSEDVFGDDGWMTVDDTGYLDEDGYLYISGRARDMIISGGVNIYPVEIEDLLARHETIADVAVVGIPDEEWGERLVGCVVPSGDFDADAVETWARERLTGYKIPRVWMTMEMLPRNATGKVVKRSLEELAATRISSEGAKVVDGNAASGAGASKKATRPAAKKKTKSAAKAPTKSAAKSPKK